MSTKVSRTRSGLLRVVPADRMINIDGRLYFIRHNGGVPVVTKHRFRGAAGKRTGVPQVTARVRSDLRAVRGGSYQKALLFRSLMREYQAERFTDDLLRSVMEELARFGLENMPLTQLGELIDELIAAARRRRSVPVDELPPFVPGGDPNPDWSGWSHFVEMFWPPDDSIALLDEEWLGFDEWRPSYGGNYSDANHQSFKTSSPPLPTTEDVVQWDKYSFHQRPQFGSTVDRWGRDESYRWDEGTQGPAPEVNPNASPPQWSPWSMPNPNIERRFRRGVGEPLEDQGPPELEAMPEFQYSTARPGEAVTEPHARRPPRPGRREAKTLSRFAKFTMLLVRALDEASEIGDLIDAIYDALPPDVRARWERGRTNRGVIDQYGQYGISGADWKIQAVYHNLHRLDTGKALENVVYNYIEDKIIGTYARGAGFRAQQAQRQLDLMQADRTIPEAELAQLWELMYQWITDHT